MNFYCRECGKLYACDKVIEPKKDCPVCKTPCVLFGKVWPKGRLEFKEDNHKEKCNICGGGFE